MRKHTDLVAGSNRLLERYLSDNSPEVDGLPRELRELVVCIHGSLFEQGLTVKVVKVRCRIRDNNVSSRFRYAFGKGIKEYIETHRMQAAGWLLRNTGLTTFEVAMEVGYEYVETFYQVFNRYFGCTPREYGRHRLTGGESRRK